MASPGRLREALDRRAAGNAAVLEAVETPDEELSALVAYLRSLGRLAAGLDREAAVAVIKQVAEAVQGGITDMTALVEAQITKPQETGDRRERP